MSNFKYHTHQPKTGSFVAVWEYNGEIHTAKFKWIKGILFRVVGRRINTTSVVPSLECWHENIREGKHTLRIITLKEQTPF